MSNFIIIVFKKLIIFKLRRAANFEHRVSANPNARQIVTSNVIVTRFLTESRQNIIILQYYYIIII